MPPARVFPPHPVRGVRAVYARQTSCFGDFAAVTVDFEPWEDGFAFEAAEAVVRGADCYPEDVPAFQEALAEGIRRELAGEQPGTVLAVAVVLREMRVHAMDSRERSFGHAGRLAAREALHRAYGRPPRPKPRPAR